MSLPMYTLSSLVQSNQININDEESLTMMCKDDREETNVSLYMQRILHITFQGLCQVSIRVTNRGINHHHHRVFFVYVRS